MFRFVGKRPWAVCLAGMLLTLLAVASLPPAHGVYWSEAQLLFVAPHGGNLASSLNGDAGQTVYFAAPVQREYAGGPARSRTAASGATHYGLGPRNDVSVPLPRPGRQWQ